MCYLKAVSKSAKISPEAERIIKELKSGELEVRDVPEEFALDSNVVKAERKLGLRKSGHRGFDVIAQIFFVEEDWFHKDLSGNLVSRLHKMTFATVYKGNIIKNLIMDCQSYTKYRPNETTGGIFVSWRRKEELPTGA